MVRSFASCGESDHAETWTTRSIAPLVLEVFYRHRQGAAGASGEAMPRQWLGAPAMGAPAANLDPDSMPPAMLAAQRVRFANQISQLVAWVVDLG